MNPYVLLCYNLSILVLTAISTVRLYVLLPDTDTIPGGSTMPMLVIVLGAMGGAIHGIASLVSHLGKGDHEPGWTAFYISRPFLGTSMALTTFLVLVSGIGGFQVKEPQALMAWSLLAGLYSQAALDKLKEIFATLFNTQGGTGGSPPRSGAPQPGSGTLPAAGAASPVSPTTPPGATLPAAPAKGP